MPAGCERTWSGACHLNHQPPQGEVHELAMECHGGNQIWTFQFSQNEETFVQLDELDELDRITHA